MHMFGIYKECKCMTYEIFLQLTKTMTKKRKEPELLNSYRKFQLLSISHHSKSQKEHFEPIDKGFQHMHAKPRLLA
jgi:hypothetical protein